MQIIGHRGIRGLAPENTLQGFRQALPHQLDWIELDVRTTRDGQAVVIHNPFVGARLWQLIALLPAKKLHTLHGHHGQPIPTLEQVLRVLGPKQKVMLELKTVSAVAPTLTLLDKLKEQNFPLDNFLIISFRPHILRRAAGHKTKVKLGLLQLTVPIRFTFIQGVKLDAVGFFHYSMPGWAVRMARRQNLFVFTHTIDSPYQAKQAKKIGVQAIVTNRPDILRKVS